MTGFLLLGVVVLWLAIAALVTVFVFRKLRKQRFRLAIVAVLFVLLVPLPVIDEIAGGFQFAKLCEAARTIGVDEAKVRGRVVRLREIPHPQLPQYTDIPRTSVPHALVPIREDSWEYIDQQSGEALFSYKTYAATGGWLIRVLGISEGNAPLTFSSHCRPQNEAAIFRDLALKKVDRRTEKLGEKK